MEKKKFLQDLSKSFLEFLFLEADNNVGKNSTIKFTFDEFDLDSPQKKQVAIAIYSPFMGYHVIEDEVENCAIIDSLSFEEIINDFSTNPICVCLIEKNSIGGSDIVVYFISENQHKRLDDEF